MVMKIFLRFHRRADGVILLSRERQLSKTGCREFPGPGLDKPEVFRKYCDAGTSFFGRFTPIAGIGQGDQMEFSQHTRLLRLAGE